MPQRSKKGPPYTDIPKEVYVVVAYPCGMNRSPRMRVQRDFDNIAAWAQLVLQQRGLGGGRPVMTECIYGMGTRDEIILQFAEGTDVIPLLGEHRWANIMRNWQGPPGDARSTCAFLYNWRDNGDPANHSWDFKFPNRLPLDTVPVNFPYPAPSWTSPPHSLANLVLPIPPPPIPPPVVDRVDVPKKEERTTTPLSPSKLAPSPAPRGEKDQRELCEHPMTPDLMGQSTSLFRPYEPPSHARPLQQQHAQSAQASTSRTSPMPPPPKFIKKLDPYELEEDALNLLRSPDPVQEDPKPVKDEDPSLSISVSIKAEDGSPSQVVPPASLGYQPTAELERYISAHLQGAIASSSASGTARVMDRSLVPPASFGCKPIAKLEKYVNAHLHGRGATAASSSDSRPTTSTRGATVKREYEDVAMSLGESKRIKIEEM